MVAKANDGCSMAMVFYLPISYYFQWTNMGIVHAENVFVRRFVVPREGGQIDVPV